MSAQPGERDHEHESRTEPAVAPTPPVQNPLTLVMRIRSPEDYQQLNDMLVQLHSQPATENPITVALNKIATVHFARFVFLENNTKLAVITTFDHDFETYIADFVDEIGQIFDMLLRHMEGAPPLPVRDHREEFLQYVRENDMPAIQPFYSAYPTLTVLDILDAADTRASEAS
jgi:hypothetical protein